MALLFDKNSKICRRVCCFLPITDQGNGVGIIAIAILVFITVIFIF